jgi:CHAT domain-containing protein
MIHSFSSPTQCKYISRAFFYGFLFSAGLSIVQPQASPEAALSVAQAKSAAGANNSARADPETLQSEQGKQIERELAGGQSHSFQMTLSAGQYVKLMIHQCGIDVVVKLFGPDRTQFAEFDSEIRAQGEEPIEWVADVTGSYRLDLLSNYKQEEAGRYGIQIMELRVATENDQVLHEARIFYTKFLCLYRAGKYNEAFPLANRVLATRERLLGAEHFDVVCSLNNLAILYFERGEYEKAEAVLRRVIKIREKRLGPEHPEVAMALNNMGIIYKERGDYARSETFFGRALDILKRLLGAHHPAVAQLLNNQAELYRERGDYAKAEPLYARAITIRERALGVEHPDVAATLNTLAQLYEETGNDTEAEKYYERALASLKKVLGPDHIMVARTLGNLANLYRDVRDDYKTAETLYDRALTILEETLGPDSIDVTRILGSLAILYRKRGDYAQAESLYERTIAEWEKKFGPDHPCTADALKEIAVLSALKGDAAHAITQLTRANAIDERNLSLSLAIGSERQKLAYLDTFSKWTDITLSLHRQAALNSPQALDLAFTTLLRRKARGLDAMTDTISTLRRHATPENQMLLDRLAEARSHLAAISLKEQDAAKPDVYRARIEPLREEVEELEAELSSRSAEFRNRAKTVTLSSVQSALPASSLLIEFACFTPRDLQTEKARPLHYLAYLLPTQGQPKWVDLGQAAPIDQAIDAWRKALRNPKRLDVKRLARVVDEKLMRPIRSILGESPHDPRHLLIAPDGSLNLIPFAALVDEQNRYLIDTYSITYLTSGRDLLRLKKTTDVSKGAPLIMANPEFGNPATTALRSGVKSSGKSRVRIRTELQVDPTQLFFQPLPASRYEALAIKALLPQASVLQKAQATETALKQARGPRILHIATHGFFYDNKRECRSPADDASRASSPRARGVVALPPTHYTVQLEARPSLESAQETVKRLKKNGIDACILKSKVNGKPGSFRVRSGKFSTQSEARKYGAFLQKKRVIREFFVANYLPSRIGGVESASTIADLRLSRYVARVKDPLLRSGLALAGANQGKSGNDDGVLTALEAAYLDLSGTKLVVLSACNSGVGDVKNGEGVQGLRRALVLAGSESQVMSLWPVSDAAAKDLMIPYYRALQQGEGRSEGLRQVQLRILRDRKDWQHPFYWAAFIQSGEWATLDGRR